jgi:hypothetical protein
MSEDTPPCAARFPNRTTSPNPPPRVPFVARPLARLVPAARTTAARTAMTTAATTAEWTALGRTAWRRGAGVERDHARHLNALAALADFAMNRCAFRSILQPCILQGRDMQEDIRRSVGGRNETKALLRIEPLDTAPQLTCGTALILIGHVQLFSRRPHASAPTPRPIARDRPLAATPHSAWGRFATKSKPDWGAKQELEGQGGGWAPVFMHCVRWIGLPRQGDSASVQVVTKAREVPLIAWRVAPLLATMDAPVIRG